MKKAILHFKIKKMTNVFLHLFVENCYIYKRTLKIKAQHNAHIKAYKKIGLLKTLIECERFVFNRK